MTATFHLLLALVLVLPGLAGASPCDDALEFAGPLPNSYSALKGLRGKRVDAALKDPALAPWLDMQNVLVQEDIRVSRSRHGLLFARDRFVKCGMCAQMARTSVISIVLPLLAYGGEFTPDEHATIDLFAGITAGKAVFVFVKGQLVGAINAVGSERNLVDTNGHVFDVIAPSFLALRDVVDSRGRIVLATGGIYEMTKEFYIERYLPALNAQGPYVSIAGARSGYKAPNERKFLRDFHLGVLNVDKLALYPRTFILNDKALPFNGQQFKSIFGERGDTPESQVRLWRNIVGALHRVRETVETEYRRDPNLTQMRGFFRENYPAPDEEALEPFEYIPEP